MKSITGLALAIVMVGAGFALTPARSQQDGVGRKDLLRQDLSVEGRELIQVRVDFAPGVGFPAHSHPGEEIAYVIEGLLEYRLEGQPPVTLKAGESLFIPAGAVHSAKNVGDAPAAELATYVVEKGKPLVVFRRVNASAK
jgi:quercetin dioxygenase-like cupin family protein